MYGCQEGAPNEERTESLTSLHDSIVHYKYQGEVAIYGDINAKIGRPRRNPRPWGVWQSLPRSSSGSLLAQGTTSRRMGTIPWTTLWFPAPSLNQTNLPSSHNLVGSVIAKRQDKKPAHRVFKTEKLIQRSLKKKKVELARDNKDRYEAELKEAFEDYSHGY
jgi:alkylated DNA nucleotide flippase Atl1